jgi:hypothetical protein
MVTRTTKASLSFINQPSLWSFVIQNNFRNNFPGLVIVLVSSLGQSNLYSKVILICAIYDPCFQFEDFCKQFENFVYKCPQTGIDGANLHHFTFLNALVWVKVWP